MSWRLVLLGIGVYAFSLRLVFITADAPPYHPYGTAWGDEGFWNWPAVIRAVQGRGSQADDPWTRLAPAYVALQEMVISCFGVNLRSLRTTSAVAGALTTLVVTTAAARSVGPAAGITAGVGYASLFPALIFERFAIPEAVACLLGALAFGAVAREPRHYAVASMLAVAATLCKVSAALFLIFVALVLVHDLFSHAGQQRPSTASALALLLVLVAPLIIAVPTVQSVSRLPDGVIAGAQGFARNALTAATAAWYYSSGITWTAGAAILIGFPAVCSTPRERRLGMLCGLWIASWFAVVPWIDAKGGRLYLMTVPLVLAGSIGWCRALESRVDFGARKRSIINRLRASIATIWIALIAAVFLSEQTEIRARLWVPVLALALLASQRKFLRTWFADRIRELLSRGRRFAWAALAIGALALQLPLLLAWAEARTYVIFSALDTVENHFPDRGDVCGQAAAVLLLGKPTMGDAILPIFRSQDCKFNGRLAKFALLPARASCQEFPGDWLEQHRQSIERNPVAARVALPGCVYSLYSLGDGAGP